MARLLALLVTLALLAPAPAASLAQGGGAFGPLPPAQPAQTPEPEGPGDINAGDDVSRQTMFLVALAVVAFFGILGWVITRDARRNLTEADRAIVEGERAAGAAPRKQDLAKMRERQRAKTRAQRQARKKTRRANRG